MLEILSATSASLEVYLRCQLGACFSLNMFFAANAFFVCKGDISACAFEKNDGFFINDMKRLLLPAPLDIPVKVRDDR